MKSIRYLSTLGLFTTLSVLLSGCVSKRVIGPNKPYAFGHEDTRRYQYDSDQFREAYGLAVEAGDNAKAKRERNDILSELMFLVDVNHGDYVRQIRLQKTGFDLITDFTILGLTGAGTVVGGEGAKTIFSAIAMGIQGSELAVNKRVFREQAIEAIQRQMDAARKDKKADILTRMKEAVDVYPLDLGLADIVEYYEAGTLTRAFQNLVKTSSDAVEQAEREIKKAKMPGEPAPAVPAMENTTE